MVENFAIILPKEDRMTKQISKTFVIASLIKEKGIV